VEGIRNMSDMPNLVLLKTRPENFDQVIRLQRHALHGEMLRAHPGDLLLLARTQPGISARVLCAMWLERQRHATAGEVDANWPGNHWGIIVEGRGCSRLDHPFYPQQEKVTQTNYGPGGAVFYVDPKDAEAFRQRGLLRPVLP
jgi:hypothetical protein